jgi:hypothetical protein
MDGTKAIPGASFVKETVGGRWHYWRPRVGKKLTGRSRFAGLSFVRQLAGGYGRRSLNLSELRRRSKIEWITILFDSAT